MAEFTQTRSLDLVFHCGLSRTVNKMPLIAIIGAGASGIAAAIRLIAAGFNQIVILEASGRIGGRIQSHTFEGIAGVVELGAQWVIGQDNNNVYNLGQQNNALDHAPDVFGNAELTFSNAEVVLHELKDKLHSILESVNVGKTDRLAEFNGALGNFLQEEFQRQLNKSGDNVDSTLTTEFFKMYEKHNCGANFFDSTLDVSANGLLDQWKCKGDRFNYFKSPGYEQIFDQLAKNVGVNFEEKVLFYKKVLSIDYSEQEQAKALIKCSDGTTVTADHVIVTLPLGVLKNNHDKIFTPPLPQKKINAIQGFGVGSSNKLILKFEEQFWSDDWQGINLLWRPTELNKIKQSKFHWILGIAGLYPAPGVKNTLYATNHGKHSILMEVAKEDNMRKGVHYILHHFLNQKLMPSVILKSTWYTDPCYHGSHSYNSISAELLEASREDLVSPLISSTGSPLVLFAGEATHSHYYSTVHGAIETGWREADRLINFYQYPSGAIPRTRFTSVRIEKSVDVLILGAGAAGVGAARKLKDSKLSFLVLEANERAGGRLHSCYLNNIDQSLREHVLIDAGGQWIHGRKNPIYSFAKERGLLIFDKSQEDTGLIIREDGVPINEELVSEVEEIVNDILEDCEKFFEEDREKYPENLDVYLTEFFEEKIAHKDPVMKMQARQLLDWMKRELQADNAAAEVNKISAKQWGSYEDVGGRREYISVRNGLGNLLTLMVNDAGPQHFLYHKVVQKIHWGTDLQLNSTEKKKVLVKCSDGSLYAANHVIVTFSLGVLKHDADNLFVPKLPQSHREAISKMGFGPLTKIFLQFDNSWLKNEAGAQLIFREDDYKGAPWTRYISGFERLMSGHVENTFQGWVVGQGAIDVEKLSDTQIHKDLLALFQQFFGTSPPYPKRYFISRWNSNPLTRGAYSYPSTDCDKDGILPSDLAAPIGLRHFHETFNFTTADLKPDAKRKVKKSKKNKPLILFAGEACHSNYYSTAHGAYLSGESQAKRIISYNRRSKSDWLQDTFDLVDFVDSLSTEKKDSDLIDILEDVLEYL